MGFEISGRQICLRNLQGGLLYLRHFMISVFGPTCLHSTFFSLFSFLHCMNCVLSAVLPLDVTLSQQYLRLYEKNCTHTIFQYQPRPTASADLPPPSHQRFGQYNLGLNPLNIVFSVKSNSGHWHWNHT